MTRRTFSPPSFIAPDTEANLGALTVMPWDVITAGEFLRALRSEDKMLANRWLYREPLGTPPFEPPRAWSAGPGAPRVIRKDRAMAWARTGGRSISARDCWQYAADQLDGLGWPGLRGPDEVQETVSFLLDHAIVRLAVPLRRWGDRHLLYAEITGV